MNITSQFLNNCKIQKVYAYSNAFALTPIRCNTKFRIADERQTRKQKTKFFSFQKLTFKTDGVSFDMIYCPSGTFNMGSANMFIRFQNPLRPERIEKDFWLGETEVTQELYLSVMKKNPSKEKTSRDKDTKKHPVEFVSWYNAIEFCNRLSLNLGLIPYYKPLQFSASNPKKIQINPNSNGFRLPTAKEWEYAAKANTDFVYVGCNDPKDIAKYSWYSNNAQGTTQAVKTLLPNGWGFYDMGGNVSEWCFDVKHNPDENKWGSAIKGGGRSTQDTTLEVARISYQSLETVVQTTGFRICMNVT